MKRAIRFTCGMIIFGLVTAGCATDAGGDGYLSSAEMTEEYRNEAKKWELAPGWTWPSVPYSGKGPDGAPAVYEQGSAQNDASFYWFCSWGSTWLDAKSPSEQAAAASRLATVPNTPFYKNLLPEERTFFDEEVLDPVSKGDATRPKPVIAANCKKGT